MTSPAPATAPSKKLRSPKPLGRFLPRLRPYRLLPSLAAVCLLIAASVGLAFPLVVRYLLDAAFQAKDRVLLNRIAIGLLGAFALQGLMNFAQVFLLTSTTERVVAALGEDVVAAVRR